MRGLVRLAQARNLGACLAVTAVLAAVCFAWPATGVVADVVFAGTPRAVSIYELSAIALAIILPSLSLGATANAERVSEHRRATLAGYAVILLAMPIVPFLAWLVRVTFLIETPEPWESPVPVIANLLIYAIVGLLAVRFVGMILGSLITLSGVIALVLAQNHFGSDILAGSFSSAAQWQWNPWVTLAAVGLTAVAMWTTRGTYGLLVDAAQDTGGQTR